MTAAEFHALRVLVEDADALATAAERYSGDLVAGDVLAIRMAIAQARKVLALAAQVGG